MMELEPIQLKEYAGYRFFVEYVSRIPQGHWFKIHTDTGSAHNITIETTESKKAAYQLVIRDFKQYLTKLKS